MTRPEAEITVPVIRHGQFDGPGAKDRNYTNFVESLTDTSKSYPLTEQGIIQVETAIRQVPGYKEIELILFSEFLRTRQSAEVISSVVQTESGHKVEIMETPILNTIYMPPTTLSEEDFNKLENTGNRNAVADEMFKYWSSGQIGETPLMVIKRIEVLLDLLINNDFTHIAVITHSSFASAVQRFIQNKDLISPRDEHGILNLSGFYYLILNKETGLKEISGLNQTELNY